MNPRFSLIFSIFKMTCPRCRKNRLFRHLFTIHPLKVLAMKERCEGCQLKYMLEPSFYFGAMYVAYAISVFLALLAFLFGMGIFLLEIHYNIIFVFFVLLITTPFSLRLSRSIWIHLFVKYDPK